jgi:hypothetical protein
MLVLHDDAEREYAYGPAQGLPDTHAGKFTQALYGEAKAKGWNVISMKNDGHFRVGELSHPSARNRVREPLSQH